MKLTEKEVRSIRKVMEFTFEDKKGNSVVIEKWVDNRDDNYDEDQSVIEGEEHYNKLSDEEQDEINDIIIISEEFYK